MPIFIPISGMQIERIAKTRDLRLEKLVLQNHFAVARAKEEALEGHAGAVWKEEGGRESGDRRDGR